MKGFLSGFSESLAMLCMIILMWPLLLAAEIGVSRDMLYLAMFAEIGWLAALFYGIMLI